MKYLARFFSSNPAHQKLILTQINANPVLLYVKSTDPICKQAIKTLKDMKIDPTVVELDDLSDGDTFANALKDLTKVTTLPSIFIKGQYFGGLVDLLEAVSSGNFYKLLGDAKIPYEHKT
ncbi:unnamed protein product [Blepharisma stoltei]|uniref:Glutaredoxin domain-containing protein n=1 Tax=Blepharisma stoltei TaxID=1481888 RepID=A0AAU9KBE5_9CILI|nr:unnamed protein product [Blepharisma stoltei]